MEAEPRWFAIITDPSAEHVAARGIKEQGYDPFLPICVYTRRFRGAIVPARGPMFPRYLFAYFAIDNRANSKGKRWQGIAHTRGVRRILGGNTPVAVPRGIIEALQARMEADGGAIVLTEAGPQRFERDQKVVFTEGVWRGIGALVQLDAGERVSILLDMLGSPHVFEVERESIAAVG